MVDVQLEYGRGRESFFRGPTNSSTAARSRLQHRPHICLAQASFHELLPNQKRPKFLHSMRGSSRTPTRAEPINRALPPLFLPFFFFFLHTYLIGVDHDQEYGDLPEHPALHSAEVSWYESPSGASPVQFLLATILWIPFHYQFRLERDLKEGSILSFYVLC
jgi:hypothetical protein